uniref:Uncharacterized protein n=1 Tax=Anguilla anguilla TaxID=7936 RepID=A0A0E9PXP4_ANGAN
MVTLVTDSEQDGHADEVCLPHNGEQISQVTHRLRH